MALAATLFGMRGWWNRPHSERQPPQVTHLLGRRVPAFGQHTDVEGGTRIAPVLPPVLGVVPRARAIHQAQPHLLSQSRQAAAAPACAAPALPPRRALDRRTKRSAQTRKLKPELTTSRATKMVINTHSTLSTLERGRHFRLSKPRLAACANKPSAMARCPGLTGGRTGAGGRVGGAGGGLDNHTIQQSNTRGRRLWNIGVKTNATPRNHSHRIRPTPPK